MKKRLAKKILSGIARTGIVKSEHILNEACRTLNAKVYTVFLDDNEPYSLVRRKTDNPILEEDRITKIYYH